MKTKKTEERQGEQREVQGRGEEIGEERREGRERKGKGKESCHETYIYTSIYNTPRGGGGCSWDGDR